MHMFWLNRAVNSPLKFGTGKSHEPHVQSWIWHSFAGYA
jgi:hypothetical protein